MEYSNPYPSSVPHITLVPSQIQVDPQFYVSLLIIEAYFLFIAVALFGLSIYFRMGNYRLMIDQSNRKQTKKQAQNIICQVIQRNSFVDQGSDTSNSDQNDKKSVYSNYDEQKAAPALRLLERRAIYLLSFTSTWIFCTSFFGANILLVIFGATFLGVGILLNVIRMIPNWKITILLYLFPAIGSLSPYVTKIPLYSWQPVLDPLSI